MFADCPPYYLVQPDGIQDRKSCVTVQFLLGFVLILGGISILVSQWIDRGTSDKNKCLDVP